MQEQKQIEGEGQRYWNGKLGRKKKIGKYMSAGDWGSRRFKPKAEEGKAKTQKRERKNGKRRNEEGNNMPDPMISYIHKISLVHDNTC